MRFRKISQSQMSGGEVNLAIKRSDEGVPFGRVIAMLATHMGVSPQAEDAPPPEAIAEATKLAHRTDRNVVHVIDDDDLWQPEWGALERQ